MAKKWSELPAWVRAKIAKTNQLKSDYSKAFSELSTSPSPGRTIQVTPPGKGTPMSEACLNKEIRKSAELNSMISHLGNKHDDPMSLANLKKMTEAQVVSVSTSEKQSRAARSGDKSRKSVLDAFFDAAAGLNLESKSTKAPSCRVGRSRLK